MRVPDKSSSIALSLKLVSVPPVLSIAVMVMSNGIPALCGVGIGAILK